MFRHPGMFRGMNGLLAVGSRYPRANELVYRQDMLQESGDHPGHLAR